MQLTPSPKLYPLIFESIPKEKIWGGENLNRLFKKGITSKTCGEIWELASLGEDISIVSNGELAGLNLKRLIDDYKGQLVGEKVYSRFGNQFPLLVKFIDANMDLSIQVHPNNDQARVYNSLGKSEMWYIVEAEPKAKLITGFSEKTDATALRKRLKDNSIEEILHHEEVKKGDIYFTPAGRIHNIGAGMVIAEIQQSSNLTYRIHDFDREGLTGQKRELHIDKALEVLDFEVVEDGKVHCELELNKLTTIVDSSHFVVNRLNFDVAVIRNLESIDSFKIYMCLEGSVSLIAGDYEMQLSPGDVYLVPALFSTIRLEPKQNSLVLETYID